MRKLVALFLAAFAVVFAWADTWTDSSGNMWTYTTNNVAATVSAVSFETTNLTIPGTLGGKAVTAFNAGVFAGKTRAVRVTIPASVAAIPAEAFLNCVNLKAVTINGSGLTSIGARAFKGCGNLEAFVMPNSVTSLGQGVFSGCSAMASVTLSDGLTVLPGVEYGSEYNGKYADTVNSTALYGSYANGLFYNCTSLKTINWGANIKTIGNIAFLYCSALEKVTIPDTVTSIGCHAFLGCSNLGEVKIGNGVTTISEDRQWGDDDRANGVPRVAEPDEGDVWLEGERDTPAGVPGLCEPAELYASRDNPVLPLPLLRGLQQGAYIRDDPDEQG